MIEASAAVGAVVVNFNAGLHLRDAVASLEAAGVERLVVIDNASNDRSAELAPSRALVRNTENVGFAKAVNQGARALAEVRLILLLNPDARLQPGSLGELVRALDRDPEAAAAGPRIVDAAGRTVVSARRFPGPSVDLLEVFRLTRILPRGLGTRLVQGPLLPRRGGATRVHWVSGACMLVRAEDWRALGGFSEEFFLYGEELDWCWRAASSGRHCLYVPEAVVEHVGGVSAATVMTPSEVDAKTHEGVRHACRRNMHPLTYRAWRGTQWLMGRAR